MMPAIDFTTSPIGTQFSIKGQETTLHIRQGWDDLTQTHNLVLMLPGMDVLIYGEGYVIVMPKREPTTA